MRRSLFLLSLVAALAPAQDLDAERYLPAPKEIQSFLDAPRHLNATLGNQSPNLRYFALSESAGMVTLADLSRPYYNLAGLQIDTKANRVRALSLRGSVAVTIVDSKDWTRTRIEAPRGSTISDVDWSPKSTQIAYLANFDDATHLYVSDILSGKTRRINKAPLNVVNARFGWCGDGESLFCVLVPTGRGAAPMRPQTPTMPRVMVADPAKNQLRTYRNLLETNEDKGLLKFMVTGQLSKIGLDGKVTSVGAPAAIASFDAAPKGDFVRVTTIQEPYSYIVPFSSFGRKEEIWDLTGKALAELSNRKLSTGGPEPTTPPVDPRRSLAWRPDGMGLSYITADTPTPRPAAGGSEDDEQGGRAGGQRGAGAQTGPPRRDKVVQWSAPFGKDDVKTVYQSENGINSLAYSADMKAIFISETVSGNENQVRIDLAGGTKQQISTRRTADQDAPNPGTLVTHEGTVLESNGNVFLRGTTAPKDPDKEAPRPFLDRVSLADGKATRIFNSSADAYETINSFLERDGSRLVIDQQKHYQINDSYLFENGTLGRKLTNNKDYSPDLTAAIRYRVFVTRPDGFKFLVRVTVPSWHTKGQKLPAMFWFYPNEYTDQAAYDRGLRGFNKNAFPNTGNTSMALLTRLGYAFVEPDCPIVGPEGRMNDSYINDLRNNLAATIDELERQGFIDRTKLALGGHSYGGFSTGNAMVHTPFFKAGIAGAGNYNRTLTPISFQTERRDIFAARSTYLEMSPILYAERMTGALLMYCGMEDQNVGTDPINSSRMFNVLESIGKPAALYRYPYEDHGQVAKETIQDMWARWVPWLAKYVLGK